MLFRSHFAGRSQVAAVRPVPVVHRQKHPHRACRRTLFHSSDAATCPPLDRNGGKRAYTSCWSTHRKTIPGRWRNILTTLRTLTENAVEHGKETKESLEELGRSAGRRLDQARDETGDALHSAASSVRKTGRQGSAAIDDCSTRTADRLDATASFIEDHDLGDALTGLQKFARRHLTGALVAAAVIGFLAASALSRVTHSRGRATQNT